MHCWEQVSNSLYANCYADAIHCINNAALPVLSIDLPSGLCSDTGSAADAAVKADISVTFIAAKQGMFSGRGPALCGEIIYHSLDIDEAAFPAAALQFRVNESR